MFSLSIRALCFVSETDISAGRLTCQRRGKLGCTGLEVVLLQGLHFRVAGKERQLLEGKAVHVVEPGQCLPAPVMNPHV